MLLDVSGDGVKVPCSDVTGQLAPALKGLTGSINRQFNILLGAWN